MAIPFPEPSPVLRFNGNIERQAIDDHFKLRSVPTSKEGRLLLTSWNIANLGVQNRPLRSLKLIAHILSRFDLVAVQEVNANYRKFTSILRLMGDEFDFMMSDKAGNEERLAFIYRKNKVSLEKLWGEVALNKNEYPRRNVTVHYRKNRQDKVQKFKNHRFVPFDRNPYIGSFRSGKIGFVLANVHLYFGAFQNSTSEIKRLKYARRVLEIYALARWAKRVSSGGNAWDRDIILLGDMNVPNMDNNEATIKALKEFGWQSVNYTTNQDGGVDVANLSHIGGSNLGNDKTYDQVAFAPSSLGGRVSKFGVFDFDNAVFQNKWKQINGELTHGRAVSLFSKYVKHHISDHRPLWVELRTT